MSPDFAIRWVFVLLLTVGLSTPALSAGGSAEPPFRFYTVVDGLTQSEVYDIEQDGSGYLWFTTARGLNRFDGKDFEHYTIADGLPTNRLTALHVDSDNAVWVGNAKGGVSLLHGARVVHTIEPLSDVEMPIIDIEVFGQRTLLVAEGAGIIEVTMEDREFKLKLIPGSAIGATNITTFGTRIWVAAET
ncbi:MAG: hypothetical protein OEM63_06170, partial [Gammaproteobacteria bacterium]|nr:hypothetical protein [Gammaproteobacteria bacterium]